jgi:hypothetical protein
LRTSQSGLFGEDMRVGQDRDQIPLRRRLHGRQ